MHLKVEVLYLAVRQNSYKTGQPLFLLSEVIDCLHLEQVTGTGTHDNFPEKLLVLVSLSRGTFDCSKIVSVAAETLLFCNSCLIIFLSRSNICDPFLLERPR